MLETALETIAGNPPAVFALAVLVGAGLFVVITSGAARGKKQIESTEGDSAPETIRAAIERLAETNTHLIAAKERELSAINDMAAIIAASNRIADKSGGDMAEFVTLMRRNMELFAAVNERASQMVQEQRLTNERLLHITQNR